MSSEVIDSRVVEGAEPVISNTVYRRTKIAEFAWIVERDDRDLKDFGAASGGCQCTQDTRDGREALQRCRLGTEID